MAASNILNNKSLNEIMDSVRRLINDLDSDQTAIPDHMMREMTIAQFVLVSHEIGWDPRTPTRPFTGTSMLTYTLAAGEYQTTLEDDNDIVAVSDVYIDRSREPLTFYPRRVLEGWINEDLKRRGEVTRGLPRAWTMEVLQAGPVSATVAEMQSRLVVYPAADESTVIYWPRTMVHTANVDPTTTNFGRGALTFQMTFALELKLAALCCEAMSDDSAAKLQIDRKTLGQRYHAEYQAAVERQQQENASWALTGRVEEYQS